MSGSTKITKTGRFYAASLESPRIDFPAEPPGPRPTAEQSYHASAARQFELALAPLGPALDEALEALREAYRGQVEILPYSDDLPDADGPRPEGVCRRVVLEGFPPAARMPGHATLELAFARRPSRKLLERLGRDVAGAVERIFVEAERRAVEELRRGPPTARFHYVRRSDGAIEDQNGYADGTPLAALAPSSGPRPLRAGLEVLAAIAQLLAAAEEDGAIHPEVEAGDVFVDSEGAISIQGFGEKRPGRHVPPAPEAPPDLCVTTGRQPDWRAVQRYNLGWLALGILSTGEPARPPREGREAHDAAVANALGALDVTVLPGDGGRRLRSLLAALLSFAPEERPRVHDAARELGALAVAAGAAPLPEWSRASRSRVQERLAAGAFGVLQPCLACGRPALRGVGVDRGLEGGGFAPDCCWGPRFARRDKLLTVALVGGLLAVVAGIVVLVAKLSRG